MEVGDEEVSKPQISDLKSWASDTWKRPELLGSLMYGAEGEPRKPPCPPFLYCVMALYTNGIRPSISFRSRILLERHQRKRETERVCD